MALDSLPPPPPSNPVVVQATPEELEALRNAVAEVVVNTLLEGAVARVWDEESVAVHFPMLNQHIPADARFGAYVRLLTNKIRVTTSADIDRVFADLHTGRVSSVIRDPAVSDDRPIVYYRLTELPAAGGDVVIWPQRLNWASFVADQLHMRTLWLQSGRLFAGNNNDHNTRNERNEHDERSSSSSSNNERSIEDNIDSIHNSINLCRGQIFMLPPPPPPSSSDLVADEDRDPTLMGTAFADEMLARRQRHSLPTAIEQMRALLRLRRDPSGQSLLETWYEFQDYCLRRLEAEQRRCQQATQDAVDLASAVHKLEVLIAAARAMAVAAGTVSMAQATEDEALPEDLRTIAASLPRLHRRVQRLRDRAVDFWDRMDRQRRFVGWTESMRVERVVRMDRLRRRQQQGDCSDSDESESDDYDESDEDMSDSSSYLSEDDMDDMDEDMEH